MAHQDSAPWWHAGLWRAPHALLSWEEVGKRPRQISFSELFFDLVMVVCFAALSDALRGDDEGDGALPLGDFVLLTVLVYSLWSYMLVYSSFFLGDDMSDKLLVSVFMTGVAGLAMHLRGRLSDRDNFDAVAVCVLLCLVTLSAALARVAWYEPRARFVCARDTATYAVDAVVWLLALARAVSPRAVLAAHAVVFAATPLLNTLTPPARRLPIHLAHFCERMSLFILIVLGENVAMVVVEPRAVHGGRRSTLYAAAALAFGAVALAKLLVFDSSHTEPDRHALRRNAWAGLLWYLTFPVLAAAVTASAAGTRLLLEMVPDHAVRSRAVWYSCGGFGAIVLLLAVQRAAHSAPARWHALHAVQLAAHAAVGGAALLLAGVAGRSAASSGGAAIFAFEIGATAVLVALNLLELHQRRAAGAGADDASKPLLHS